MDLFGRKYKKMQIEIDSLKKYILEMQKSSRGYLQGFNPTDAVSGRESRINYGTLLHVYKSVSWVRACVDAIKRTSLASGYKLVVPDGINVDEKSIEKVKLNLKHPNEDETFTDILGDVVIDLEIYGDAYIEVVKQEKYLQLYNLFAPAMRVRVDRHGTVLGYVMKGTYPERKDVHFKPEEVIHFRLPNPGNEVYGLSPLESIQLPLEVDLWAQIYNKNFFKNDATPRGHLDLGNCSRAQLERTRQYWNTHMKGAKNAHKTIITEGGAKYSSIGTPPKDMEFLNQRKFNRDEIIAVYGVPPAKIGIFETANRANSKEQDKTFKSETIIPLQRMIAEKINRKLMPKFGVPVEFHFNEVDLRDESEQSKVDEVYLEQGVVTVNEIRKRKGLKPFDNKKYDQPYAFKKLKEIDKGIEIDFDAEDEEE